MAKSGKAMLKKGMGSFLNASRDAEHVKGVLLKLPGRSEEQMLMVQHAHGSLKV